MSSDPLDQMNNSLQEKQTLVICPKCNGSGMMPRSWVPGYTVTMEKLEKKDYCRLVPCNKCGQIGALYVRQSP